MQQTSSRKSSGSLHDLEWEPRAILQGVQGVIPLPGVTSSEQSHGVRPAVTPQPAVVQNPPAPRQPREAG